jgi:pimeloyl-ACP methyl ester carboxylesterase
MMIPTVAMSESLRVPSVEDELPGDAAPASRGPLPAPAPLAFGGPEHPLFGFFHPPSSALSRDAGVVLCNPLGHEAMCAHRTYRHLAERLAANGVAVLRFDYHGTGDSSGDPEEPERVAAWLRGINAAVAELRARAGVQRTVLFGVRFGATLASWVAADRGDIDDLVLWAPFSSGREFLRELRAFRLIKRPIMGAVPRIADGGEEAAGYAFDRHTVSAISAIEPLARTGPFAKRILIVPRDDLPGSDARLARHLVKQGADVHVAYEPGYALMMRDPQDTVVPIATLEKMVAWVAQGAATAPAMSPASEPRGVLTTTGRGRTDPVRERALHFAEGRRLFGIITEPVDRGLLPGRPAFLFLNVGANHHVGPNRMYVAAARALAPQGYLCLRFDVAGIGDSKRAPGGRENRLYSKDSLYDVKAAMTLLQDTYGVDRFVLAGLCSGAYLAFHTCVEDARVVGQILMNPQTFEWREGDSLELSSRNSFLSTRYYVKALFQPSTWKRVLKGQVNVSLVARVMRDRLKNKTKSALQGLAHRARTKEESLTDVARAFRAMSDRGVDSLLLFSFNDGGLDMIESHLGRDVRKMRGRKNFHFEIVEGADHTFTPVDSQARLHDLLVHHATSHFR